MASDRDLQQQLQALIAGQLSPDDEDRWVQRITSDPEVARAYAEAVLLAEQQHRSNGDKSICTARHQRCGVLRRWRKRVASLLGRVLGVR